MTQRKGFVLGSWTVYPLEGQLVGNGETRRVQPKSMDVLLCLADSAGEVVEREKLLAAVWGERAPSDEPLTRCIGELRRALGDSPSAPEYILTVPKRGYRLLQPVTEIEPVETVKKDLPGMDGAPAGFITRLVKFSVAAAILLLVAVVLLQTAGKRPAGNTNPEPAAGTPAGADSTVGLNRSIVVLPFVNMSPDEEQEYFSDGISEELLNLLAQVPELRVISRSSAFYYKDKTVNIQTVAEQLNVTHVLEGSVRKSGEQVRITAQLIDARNDDHLWSETYERTLDDIFATQDEIAAKVVEQLKIRLLGNGSTSRTNVPEAYVLFLRARHLGRQFTPEAFEQSIALLEQALALDPEYAAAWDELGRLYRRQAGQGLRPVDESYAMARDATNRALHLDDSLAPAYRSLAVIARNHDRDLATAARHIERAYELEPVNADSISNAAAMASALGRMEQATTLAEYALARDPVNPLITSFTGVLYLHVGRLDEAIATFRSTLILNPGFVGMKFLIGEGLLLKGEADNALANMQEEADEGYRLIGLVMAHHALGQETESDAALSELIDKYERDAPYNIAQALSFRDQADVAFEWLEKAVTYNDPGLTDITTDPLFVNIHSDPRWLPFLESIGKSPGQLAAIRFDVTLPR